MVLQVEFEGFSAAVREYIGLTRAYVAVSHGQTLVSAAKPKEGLVVQAYTSLSVQEAREKLAQEGLPMADGVWLDPAGPSDQTEALTAWVAAVSYQSAERKPGLWLDAFPDPPSTSDVLTALYDEFVETGELQDMSLEQFIRIATPNVVILSPEDQARYLRKHLEEVCADAAPPRRP